jgi:hypothetical protein
VKTLLIAPLLLALLAADAFASKWTPTGGDTKNPAPEGSYTGRVERIADGNKVTWKIHTDKGVLEVDEDDCDTEEEETLDIAAGQNDKNNTVKIDKYGKVDSVSTG